MITVEKYGRRHFAVYLNGGLPAVTLYKRGAWKFRNARNVAAAFRIFAAD